MAGDLERLLVPAGRGHELDGLPRAPIGSIERV